MQSLHHIFELPDIAQQRTDDIIHRAVRDLAGQRRKLPPAPAGHYWAEQIDADFEGDNYVIRATWTLTETGEGTGWQ